MAGAGTMQKQGTMKKSVNKTLLGSAKSAKYADWS